MPSKPGLPPPLPEVREDLRERRLAACFAAIGIAVFLIAAVLDPYDDSGRPRRYGTHCQLGLPPCLMKQITGLGCPTCGMTTSVSLVMHGELAAAWRANAVGVIAACLGAGATVWMLAAAAGFRLCRFAVDDAITWLTISGTTAALTRWVAEMIAQRGG